MAEQQLQRDLLLLKRIRENDEALRRVGFGFRSVPSVDFVRELSAALGGANNTHVEELSLGEIAGFDEERVVLLSGALKTNKTLRALKFSRIKLTDAGVRALANALSSNPSSSLRTLQLGSDYARRQMVFSNWQNLHPNISAVGALALAELLKGNNASSIVRLNLCNCNVDDEGAICLAKHGLRNNGTLLELNLARNHITERGADALAKALGKRGSKGARGKKNSTLRELRLFRNPIGSSGAAALADALKEDSCGLRVLHLYGCGVDDEWAVLGFADALRVNRNLDELDLAGNSGGTTGHAQQILCEAIRLHNTSLQHLNLGICRRPHSRRDRAIPSAEPGAAQRRR